jgi:hypothetical protein
MSAAAATTTVTAARTAATATTTTALWGTVFARAGDVHGHGTAIQRGAIESVNGFLRFFRAGHGDKAETAGTAASAVDHEVSFDDCSMGRKRVLQIVFGCVEGKISNKQFGAHVMFDCP